MDYPGNLFVVAAPSGAGKSSLVNALLELDSHVQPSVSHTTRAPRGQEKHGREYYFASEQEFDAMVAAKGFVEWAHVHSNRYGITEQRGGANTVVAAKTPGLSGNGGDHPVRPYRDNLANGVIPIISDIDVAAAV